MKKRKRSLQGGILLAAGLMMTMAFGQIAAYAEEETEPYTYTVRIFAGDYGTINGGSVQIADGLSGDDSVEIGSIQIAGGPYDRVKGVRESGKGDGDSIYVGSVPVGGRDRDYVVVYGVSGSTVKYTVEYVDAAGNPIPGYEPEEYYGNVGDKVIVPSKRIPGYFPDAENKTKAKNGLSEDAGSNVFTFVYQPNPEVPPEVTTVTETVNETVETTQTVETTVPVTAPAQAAPAAPAGTAGGTGNTAGTGGTAGGTGNTAGTGGTAGGTGNTAGTGGTAGSTGSPAAAGGISNPSSTNGTVGDAAGTAGTQETNSTAAQVANPNAGAPIAAEPAGGEPGAVNGQTALPATPEEVPEIVDIDEESVPMAGVSDDQKDGTAIESGESAADGQEEEGEPSEEDGNGSRNGMFGGIIIAVCAVVAAVIAVVLYRKRLMQQEEE